MTAALDLALAPAVFDAEHLNYYPAYRSDALTAKYGQNLTLPAVDADAEVQKILSTGAEYHLELIADPAGKTVLNSTVIVGIKTLKDAQLLAHNLMGKTIGDTLNPNRNNNESRTYLNKCPITGVQQTQYKPQRSAIITRAVISVSEYSYDKVTAAELLAYEGEKPHYSYYDSACAQIENLRTLHPSSSITAATKANIELIELPEQYHHQMRLSVRRLFQLWDDEET